MFNAFVQDCNGEVIKTYDDCFRVMVLPEHDMQLQYPDIYASFDLHCPYIMLVDSQGAHFYPLFYYSVEIG